MAKAKSAEEMQAQELVKANKLKTIMTRSAEWRRQPCKDIDEVKARCEEFINICINQDPPQIPIPECFADFLGISSETLHKWKVGEGCPEAQKEAVQRVFTWMAGIWTQANAESLINQVATIWNDKQWFDKKEPDSKMPLFVVSPLKELPSAESIRAKYAELPETDYIEVKPEKIKVSDPK